MKQVFLWLIRFYRQAISPRKPAMCKYIPTCSQYTYQAICKYGAIPGAGADTIRSPRKRTRRIRRAKEELDDSL